MGWRSLFGGPSTPPSVDSFVAALLAGGDAGSIAKRILETASASNRAGTAELQRQIDAAIRAGDASRLGRLALLAGAIVERGGAPEDLAPAIFDAIATWFRNAPDEPPRGDREVVTDDMDPFPEAFYLFERAAMAALGRSRELRRSLPQKAAIQGSVKRYEQRYGFTNKMLSVLDNEQIVVLHPVSGRGWICRIDGVADNFQLHALLLDALAGAGPDRIPGTRPSVADAAACGAGDSTAGGTVVSDWQLASWTALQPNHSVSPDHKSGWIWNEGYPAEIEVFEGARVILVGASTYSRSWQAGRTFDAMPGSLTVESALPGARDVLDESAARVASRGVKA